MTRAGGATFFAVDFYGQNVLVISELLLSLQAKTY
jgi:hypothetical protein